MITAKGRQLARKLNPAIGTTSAIEETCSLICRHAATHHRLAEADCGGDGTNWTEEWQADLDGRIASVEVRLERLVEDLPHTDDGPFRLHLQGDPRGATVKLLAPPPWEYLYDGWANEAIIVP